MNRSNPRFNLRNLEENLQNMMENILETYLNPNNVNSTVGDVPAPVPVPSSVPVPSPPVTIPSPPVTIPVQARHVSTGVPVQLPNINNRNQRYVDQMAIVHTLREIMNACNSNTREYSSNMREYSSNFHEYSSNIDFVLQILRTMYEESNADNRRTSSSLETNPENTFQPTTSPTTNAGPTSNAGPRPSTNSVSSPSPLTAYYTIRQIYNTPQVNTREDVIVRPSNEEINRATQGLVYSNDIIFMNSQCPISLDEFTEGELVRRILHCGHTFREAPIRRWFETNVRCPVCRHDIRDISNNLPVNINEPDSVIDSSNQDRVHYLPQGEGFVENFVEGLYNNFNNTLPSDINMSQGTLTNSQELLDREDDDREDLMIDDYRIEVSLEDMDRTLSRVQITRDVSGRTIYRI